MRNVKEEVLALALWEYPLGGGELGPESVSSCAGLGGGEGSLGEFRGDIETRKVGGMSE